MTECMKLPYIFMKLPIYTLTIFDFVPMSLWGI